MAECRRRRGGTSRKSHHRRWNSEETSQPRRRVYRDIDAKKAEAAFRVSVARRNSEFSDMPGGLRTRANGVGSAGFR